MPEEIVVEIHGKNVSDVQLSRLLRASSRKYSVPITAFISDAFVAEDKVDCAKTALPHLPQLNDGQARRRALSPQ